MDDSVNEQMLASRFEPIIDGILAHGYGIVDDFLNPGEVTALASQLHDRRQAGLFKSAGIGNKLVTIEQTIRGDEILWIDEATTNPAELVFLERVNDFVDYVNRTCYLGLHDSEFHYALYPPGTFYKRHLDQFRSDSRRKLSVICYLNTNWQDEDGGQLALFVPETTGSSEREVVIQPIGGRLVCFESARLEHEVRPATRERLSMTGWLKTR